jgi:hypothetical protein
MDDCQKKGSGGYGGNSSGAEILKRELAALSIQDNRGNGALDLEQQQWMEREWRQWW